MSIIESSFVRKWSSLLILNDSACYFYYKAIHYVNPFKKSNRVVTCVLKIEKLWGHKYDSITRKKQAVTKKQNAKKESKLIHKFEGRHAFEIELQIFAISGLLLQFVGHNI